MEDEMEAEMELGEGTLGSRNFEVSSSEMEESMSALEILRETVRILRHNASPFLLIATLLISPVSAILLSKVLVNQSLVSGLTLRLLLASKSSGLPLSFFVKHTCNLFSETAVSALTCFPLFLTFLLLSKAAIAYSVDCTYSRKEVEFAKFCAAMNKIWKNVVSTYVWASAAVAGCVTLFCVVVLALCSFFSWLGLLSELNFFMLLIAGLIFSVIFANALVICSVAVVVSVLEDAGGFQALLRANGLIKGKTQVGILMYLGYITGIGFVNGLFEHRVITVSYGDGSSRRWEGPLLVIMYSFVVLIYSMMTSVFYFDCKPRGIGASDEDCQSILHPSTPQ